MIDTKALRQKILDLAMRGKLVPQDPNDEPVENLLARIKGERHRLEKEKKISKAVDSDIFWSDDDNCYYEKLTNNENVVDDIPYDTPNNWVWCRFGSLANIQTGATFNKEVAITNEKPNYIRVLRGGNISPFKWAEKYDDLFIPRELVKDSIILSIGDIITPAVTSLENVGKFGLVESSLSKEITVGGFVFLIRPHLNDQILSKYIFYVLSSDELINSIKNITKKSGSAFYNINKEAFKNLLFSLPPLQEQQRIVAKLDELFALIDKIEKEQDELEEYKKLAKEKVLELAVTGKLVKQDPNDEPASELLERIKKEKEALIKAGKIKKDKADSEPLSDDDKNYYKNLPNGWTVCRLANIGYITGGGTPKTDVSKYWGGEINWLTPAEMSNFRSVFFESTKKRITAEGLASSSAKIIKPFSVIMSSRAPIGYLAININDCTTSQGCKSITRYSNDLFDLNYLYFLIKSKVKQYNSESSGTTFKEISGSEFGKTIVSIPPLFEQRRICKLLESIISTIAF